MRSRKGNVEVGTNLQDRYRVAIVTRFPRDFDIAKVCSFGVQGDRCLAAWRNGDRLSPYATIGIVAGIKHRYRPEEMTGQAIQVEPVA